MGEGERGRRNYYSTGPWRKGWRREEEAGKARGIGGGREGEEELLQYRPLEEGVEEGGGSG